jgi:hypothetical protein
MPAPPNLLLGCDINSSLMLTIGFEIVHGGGVVLGDDHG